MEDLIDFIAELKRLSNIDYCESAEDMQSALEEINHFIEDSKWQQERIYSEEDMNKYAEYCTSHVLKSQIGHAYLSVTEWVEQYKK
jgi:hypothetical protein